MQPRLTYSIDCMPGTFDDRVFLGGDYRYGALIQAMADAVTDCGMTPIIAWQFGIEPGTERDSSLILLQKCKFAIFEMSSDAGQMAELENAISFGTIVLCLWDASASDRPRISAMATSNPLFKANNRGYRTTRELQYHVYDFLHRQ